MHIGDYLATLDFVNRQRAARGLEPLDHLPEGSPGDSRDCVIARAVPGSRVTRIISSNDGRPAVVPPRAVRSFISAFDRQGLTQGKAVSDPGKLVDGGIDDDKGCLVCL